MINHVFNNWNLAPIEIIAEFDSCPDQWENLFTYSFPGIRDGCNCLNNFNIGSYPEYENKILVGPCSLLLTQNNCVSIEGRIGTNINSFGKKSICVKRNNNFNYYQNYSLIYKNFCPSNTINCGIIDTVNGILCIPKENECPIKNTNLFDEYIEFSISQGYMCINNNEINLNVSHVYDLFENRKLLKCNTTIHEMKYDKRYKEIMNIKGYEFFNNKTINYLNSLPNFESDFFERKMTLYGRKYIGWSKNCETSMDHILNIKYVIDIIERYSVYYLIYSLFILIYCMLFIMILKELIFEQYYLKIGIISIHFILISILWLKMVNDYISMKDKKDFIYSLVLRRCSDEETNLLMFYIHKVINDVMKLYVFILSLYAIMCCISIFKILMLFYKIHKRSILRNIMAGETSVVELMILI